MTNFNQLSPKAQEESARFIARSTGEPFEVVFARMKAAGDITDSRRRQLEEQMRLEEERAIRTIASNANTQRERDLFRQQFPEFADLVNDPIINNFDRNAAQVQEYINIVKQSPLLAQQRQIIDDSFQLKDAFGNILAQGQDVLSFDVNNRGTSIIAAQNAGFIEKAQVEIFNNALSKGTFAILTDEDVERIAFLKGEILKKENALENDIESTILPTRTRLIELKQELERVQEKQKSGAKLTPAENSTLKSALDTIDKLEANILKTRTTLSNAGKVEINKLQTELNELENKQFAFTELDIFRQKIIDDIESFRNDRNIDRTEQIVLEDLITQGTLFIQNILTRGVDFPQDKISELQLAILDAVEFAKRKGMTQQEESNNNASEVLDNLIKNTEFGISSSQGESDGFLDGLFDFGADIGNAFASVFNPPEPELVEQFVKVARAQQAAALILQSEAAN